MRRATCRLVRLFRAAFISIHALREEGDGYTQVGNLTKAQFLSTPSARRATEPKQRNAVQLQNFYPRPPRGGRPPVGTLEGVYGRISIHALREEGDPSTSCVRLSKFNFYPRPPRGGRQSLLATASFCCSFLSTPSARRATSRPPWCRYSAGYFYPRPPRGGRPNTFFSKDNKLPISIHALREEGDLRYK